MIPRRAFVLVSVLAAGCVTLGDQTPMAPQDAAPAVVAHPEIWPEGHPPPADQAVEARVEQILARMTLEEKVGQTIQADIGSVTPDDVRTYNLGSVLNGGGSAPDGNLRATPQEWLALADAFWEASTDTSDGGVGAPVIWGTDAVHGHNKAVGATIFPHNIGLGAANDPDLVRRAEQVTAVEMRVTGHDWTFAPTLAVPQNDRWGRTYEGFSEDPAIVAALAGAYVEGIQGEAGTSDFLSADHVIATAKHFLGDGGTTNGVDQGDTRVSEETLRDVHAAGYYPAVNAGVQTVMASYSSWMGDKMHGRGDLLTGVLKNRMGFDGFIVGDWNGHGQVPGCTAESCAAAYNAGVDMMMAPNSWKDLYENTLEQVRSGAISEARLDDAVRRILRVKVRAGVLDEPKPSERPHGGDTSLLGSPDHRAIAREAARRSLVLLKNNNGVLPLPTEQNVLVAGRGADSIMRQTGGWTISWQGTDNTNADFPGATSIWEGIEQTVSAGGGTAHLDVEGHYRSRPDVAIVVFGETPYAEGVGDRNTLAYSPDDETDLALLRRLKEARIPVVAVFLSGRPLWVNREMNQADAFVAAWLPGSEGAAIADVLFTAPDGHTRYDFEGKLSFSWPRTAAPTPVNNSDADYDPLFPVGYGLTYEDHMATVPELSEDPGVDLEAAEARSSFVFDGAPLRPWRFQTIAAGGGPVGAETLRMTTGDGAASFTWSGGVAASAAVSSFTPADLGFYSNADMSLLVRMRADHAPEHAVSLGVASAGAVGATDVAGPLAAAPGEWVEVRARLRCLAAAGGVDIAAVNRPVMLTASEPITIDIAEARLVEGAATDACP